MQSVPQPERGVSSAARHLTASAWPSANKQEVTLSFPKLRRRTTTDASYNCIHEHLAEPDLPEEALHSKDLANVHLWLDSLSFIYKYIFVTGKNRRLRSFFFHY